MRQHEMCYILLLSQGSRQYKIRSHALSGDLTYGRHFAIILEEKF